MKEQLTRKETCQILKISRSKFYELLAGEDPLPAYKLGDGPKAEYRVDPDELTAWRKRRTGILFDQPRPITKSRKRRPQRTPQVYDLRYPTKAIN
jgi:hypothetical protein